MGGIPPILPILPIFSGSLPNSEKGFTADGRRRAGTQWHGPKGGYKWVWACKDMARWGGRQTETPRSKLKRRFTFKTLSP
jgi:hypothetical protein